MNNSKKDLNIQIVCEGKSEDNGHNVPLSDFLRIVDSCNKLLKQAAKSALKDQKYKIILVNLQHSSPASVHVSVNSPVEEYAGYRVFLLLSKQQQAIMSNNAESLGKGVLKTWQKFANLRNGNVDKISMEAVGGKFDALNDPKFEVTDDLQYAVLDALLQETVCDTSIVGRVDSVNLHNLNKCTLKLYSEVPQWEPVPVNFDYQFKGDVINAIEKVVRIYGNALYRPGRAMPVSMEMERIQILKDDPPLNLADLKGVAPNITGGKSLQEYLDDMRKEWE